MTTTDFDPTAPLPGPPEPWRSTGRPSPRPGPPFHMTDMIAAEPHLASRLLTVLNAPDSSAARLAGDIRAALDARRPVVVTGCGTSEHAAIGAVAILRDAIAAPHGLITAEQAFELALDGPTDALVVGISHEGGTTATNRALQVARDGGCRTALVTVSEASPGAAFADLVVATGELDQSWCHTVGYASPLLAIAAVAGHLSGRAPDPDTVGGLLAAGAAREADAEAISARFADATQLIVIASGADRAAGRELAIKVEEGAWLPTAYRDLETYLHGHFPAADERTGLVLLLADRDGRDARIPRARQALAGVAVLGVRAAAIVAQDVSEGLSADLTPGGRIVVPDASDLPAPVAALLGTATALQLLTERIARARGTNPDPIRRDDSRYRAASDAAAG